MCYVIHDILFIVYYNLKLVNIFLAPQYEVLNKGKQKLQCHT